MNNILGEERAKFIHKFKIRIVALCAAAVAVITLNVTLCVFLTDALFVPFVIINILSDSALLCFVYAYSKLVLLPMTRKKKLYDKAKEPKICTVTGISPDTVSVNKLDCYVVSCECAGVELNLYALSRAFESGVTYAFYLSDNVIVRWENECQTQESSAI